MNYLIPRWKIQVSYWVRLVCKWYYILLFTYDILHLWLWILIAQRHSIMWVHKESTLNLNSAFYKCYIYPFSNRYVIFMGAHKWQNSRRDSNLLQSFSILQSFSGFFKRKPSLFEWKPSLIERRLYYTFLLYMKTFFDPSLIERRLYYTFLL